MREKDLFDILENAENDSMERLIDKCPELSDEQLDRILAMSEKKFRKQMAQAEGTEREATIKMTKNDDVSGVEVEKRPAWLTPLATAASIVLIAGIAIGSTAMLKRNHKPGGGGGVVTPAVTVTTTSGTGTTPSSTGPKGSVTGTTTTSANTSAVTSLVPGSGDTAEEKAENALLKPFAGTWVYQASSGNYTVDQGANNIGTVEIRGDGTYTYTENSGNVTTDRVERTVDEIAGTQLVTLVFYDGTAIKFAATYNEGLDQLGIGNGGLERLVRAGSAEASAPSVTASWKTAYKQVLTDFMNTSEYSSESMWDVRDIDNDGVPELLLSRGTFHAAGVRIYYYENGNAVPVLADDGTIAEYGVYGAFMYKPAEHLLGSYNMHMGFESCATSSYEGHTITLLHMITNNSGNAGEEAAEYTIDNVQVSKEEYDSARDQWDAMNWIVAGQQYYFTDLSPLS